MKFRRGESRAGTLWGSALLLLAGLALLLPATSSAAWYPDDPSSRNFDGGAGGWRGQAWQGGSVSDLLPIGDLGLCPLICTELQFGHVPTGGSGGGGYLGTSASGLISLGSAGTIWESIPFKYEGDGGKQAEIVTFNMDVLAEGGSLLGLLNSVDPNSLAALEGITVEVKLLRNSSGDAVAGVLLEKTELADLLKLNLSQIEQLGQASERQWRPVETKILNPAGKLTIGDFYRLEVTTSFDGLIGLGLLSALPQFELGIDNVSLNALAGSGQPGGPGGPGGPGSDGKDGKDGQGGSGGKDGADGKQGASGAVLNKKTLTRTIRRATPKRVRIARNARWIRIPVHCPKKFNKRCKFVTVAKFKRNGPAITRAKHRAVGKGVRRGQALFVKRKFRAKVKRAKRVLIQQTVKVGKVKVRVIKPVRLIRR